MVPSGAVLVVDQAPFPLRVVTLVDGLATPIDWEADIRPLTLCTLVETTVPPVGLVSPGCQTLLMDFQTGLLEPSIAGKLSEN